MKDSPTKNLDPDNWDEFAEYISNFSADEVRALADSLKNEVWKPVPEELKKVFESQSVPEQGNSLKNVVETYKTNIRPYRNGNTHPRFFGWVQGPGTAASLVADIAISAMNSNCGGRDHGAIYIERQVVSWCKQIFGYESHAGGLLTTGTSASTHLALQVAIFKKLGLDYKNKGFFGENKPLRCYTSREGHSSIIKAIQTSGIGSDNLIVVETDKHNQLDTVDLNNQIQKDLLQGYLPFMVIATAGTVNTGAFDNFKKIRQICDQYDCWMHVDGAFGAWLKIAHNPYKELTLGMGNADSLAFDFHKLMYVQYECGGLICKDGDFQQQVFSIRPNYLAPHGQALAGGDPWFCDFGLELSRSFRALKVWFTFQTYGVDKLGLAITENCRMAAYFAQLIGQSGKFELMNQAVSTIVTFKLQNQSIEINNSQCEQIVSQLQLSGEAVLSLTNQGGYRVIRAAIINHRTSVDDIEFVAKRLNELADELNA